MDATAESLPEEFLLSSPDTALRQVKEGIGGACSGRPARRLIRPAVVALGQAGKVLAVNQAVLVEISPIVVSRRAGQTTKAVFQGLQVQPVDDMVAVDITISQPTRCNVNDSWLITAGSRRGDGNI